MDERPLEGCAGWSRSSATEGGLSGTVAPSGFIEPTDRTLEVYELDGPTYRLLGTYADAERARAVPFDAIELDLAVLWLR